MASETAVEGSMVSEIECPICTEKSELILHETRGSRIIWGAGSYGNATKVGHCMAVPIRHVADVGQLSNEEMIDLIKAVDVATRSSYSAWFTSSSWGKANIGAKVRACSRAAMI